MDPVSIIGLIASVGSVADIAARSISKLSQLRTKYRDAPFVIAVLIGQLCTITTALEQLKEWSKNHLARNPRFEKLASQLQEALVNFQPMLYLLDKELKTHNQEETNNITPKDRLCFVWKEQDLRNYIQILDYQVNALTLLLQAVQCKTWTDQTTLMSTDDSQSIIRYARDCSSSIMALKDGISTCATSNVLESDDAASRKFDFDHELLCSSVYGTACRFHFRQTIEIAKQTIQPTQATDTVSVRATTVVTKPKSEVVALNSPMATNFFHSIILPELAHYRFSVDGWLVKLRRHGQVQFQCRVILCREVSKHTLNDLSRWSVIERAIILTKQSSWIRDWALDVNEHLILSKRPIEYALGFIAECSLLAVNRDTTSSKINVLSAAGDVASWYISLEVITKTIGSEVLRREYLRVGMLANLDNMWGKTFYIAHGAPMDFS